MPLIEGLPLEPLDHLALQARAGASTPVRFCSPIISPRRRSALIRIAASTSSVWFFV